jgi:hypothetical protein
VEKNCLQPGCKSMDLICSPFTILKTSLTF